MARIPITALGCALLMSILTTANTAQGGREARGVFPYRAWAFCVYSHDWDLLERSVDDAIARAKDYGINTFELHDYNMGGRGIVDGSITYKAFPKLAGHKTLTYRGEVMSLADKEADYQRFRALAKKIKAAGLKLNVWYHVMRDAPAELSADYPEIKDLDSGFLWKYLDGTLREFFERMPEVDRLTITSLHETPSVMSNTSAMSRDQRLLKLYDTIYKACRDSGKELVIRDFIVRKEDFDSFLSILDKLPPDIYVMTKEVLSDWVHQWQAPNPYMWRYAGRKLVVEFDLYGEYWGRMDVPNCYPQYIYNSIRLLKSYHAVGAVGRVVHEAFRSDNFRSVFESPNDINCYAFGRFLSRPIPWIETNGAWSWDIDAFDDSVWMDWAAKRYGAKAAVPVIRALKRTERIVPLMFDVGGYAFQMHSAAPPPNWSSVVWAPFVDRVRKLGIDYVRDEKRQACAMVSQCLADVEEAKPALSDADYAQLRKLFEGELLIARAYQAIAEGYYQLYLTLSQPDPDGLKKAAQDLASLADEVRGARGETFFCGLAGTLKAQSEYVSSGKAPGRK